MPRTPRHESQPGGNLPEREQDAGVEVGGSRDFFQGGSPWHEEDSCVRHTLTAALKKEC